MGQLGPSFGTVRSRPAGRMRATVAMLSRRHMCTTAAAQLSVLSALGQPAERAQLW